MKANANYSGPAFLSSCTNTWFGSALRTPDASGYLTDQQFPNASLPPGSPEIRSLRVIGIDPSDQSPIVGHGIAFPPPLPCPVAMGTLVGPALAGQLNPEFESFAYGGPFNPVC